MCKKIAGVCMCEALKRIRSGKDLGFYYKVGMAINDIDSRNREINDKMVGKHSSELKYAGDERRKSARQ